MARGECELGFIQKSLALVGVLYLWENYSIAFCSQFTVVLP
jgi:hypothetical protein